MLLSHCIVQASRPRSIISPIPFAIGVLLDHTFGSQSLLNTFARLGLSVSHDDDDNFFFPYNKNWTTLLKLNRRRNLFAGYKADVVFMQRSL